MHTDYILALITFAVFGGTESARLFWFEPPPLLSTQDKFNILNIATYPTLEALEEYVRNTENFQRSQQGTIINNAKYAFTNTTMTTVNKAKEEGKNVNTNCISDAKTQYLSGLETINQESKKCIDDATETVINTINGARQFYLNISSNGYIATQNYERQWATECLTLGNEKCMAYMAFAILHMIERTETESKNAIEKSKKAYTNQKSTWIKCRTTLQDKIKELDEKHAAKMAECIERDWSLNWVL